MIKQHIYHFSLRFLPVEFSNSLWSSDVLLYLEFINILPILFYNFIEFIILLFTFLGTFVLDKKNIWFDEFHLVSFQMCDSFLIVQVQEAFVLVSNILIYLHFCCLSKSRIFSTIFFFFICDFNCFLSIALLKSINPLFMLFTNCSRLAWLSLNLIKSFDKSDGFSYLQ